MDNLRVAPIKDTIDFKMVPHAYRRMEHEIVRKSEYVQIITKRKTRERARKT